MISICTKNTPMNKGGDFLSIIWNGNYPDRVWMWMYNGSLPIWNRNVSAGTCEGRSFKVIDKRSSHYMSFSSHRELYWGGKSWRAHCQNATARDVKRNPRLIIPSIHRTSGGRRSKSQNKAFSALSTKPTVFVSPTTRCMFKFIKTLWFQMFYTRYMLHVHVNQLDLHVKSPLSSCITGIMQHPQHRPIKRQFQLL